MFQYIADATGFQIDQVLYLTLFVLSYPLAVFFLIGLKYTNIVIRNVYSIALGVLFCFLCFGIGQLLFLIAFVAVGYVLLKTLSPKKVQTISFFYAMACIAAAHIYRVITDYGGFHLDFTGPFMLMVQRVTYVGFAYHDGFGKEDKDLKNEDQRINKITKFPSILEYFSYNFCFLTVLAGPTCTYNEFIQMINGENFELNRKVGRVYQNPLLPAVKKFFTAIFFLLLFLFLKSNTNCEKAMLDDATPFYLRLMYITVFCFYIRCRYYFIYRITESISNTAGLGFYYDANDNPKWDLVSTIELWNFEFGVNCKVQSNAWNICTQKWLRRTVYERPILPLLPVLQTFLVSAWWHGLYPGYYMSFVFLGTVTIAARKMRYFLWHRFQSPRYAKVLYDISTIVTSNFYKDFAEMSFLHLSFEVVLRIWKFYYFAPVIMAVLVVLVLPDKKIKPVKQNGVLQEETDKKLQ